jgi:DNA sulfur modification protein DndB
MTNNSKSNQLSREFTHSFPAIRGVQAGREYYVTMCPLKLLPAMFRSGENDLSPELRAQREMNKVRIPPITRYLLENQDSYVFSAIAASIDGEVQFEAYGTDIIGNKIGSLCVPMDAQFIINDGQHRLAAIKDALRYNPVLQYETISVVLFVDAGLKRSQQMFADLNRYAVRPTKSLNILYDHRDPMARLSHKLSDEIPAFKGMTEMAKSSISNRSRKLFTLSSIYQATKRLLQKKDGEPISSEEKKLVFDFWQTVTQYIPDWRDALARKVSPSELRSDYIHAHGIALQALAIAGNSLINSYPYDWQRQLAKIKQIDWSRSNAQLWEGRAMIGGTLNKSQKNVILTANVIKNVLGLSLDPQEATVEKSYVKGQPSA